MPNIILDLRECTDEQKEVVLRVMETDGYRWASGHLPLSPPFRLGEFTYLFMQGERLMKGNCISPDEIYNRQSYDYVVPNISTWFATEELRNAVEADQAAFREAYL